MSTLLDLSVDALPSAEGKVIFITGGSSGIGLECAKIFIKKGAKGIIIADLNPPKEAILSESVIYTPMDVTSWSSSTLAFETAIENFDKIDYVFANAGIGEIGHLFVDQIDDKGELKEPNLKVLDINVKGVMYTVKLAVYWFRKLKVEGGRIVMTTSIFGYDSPGTPVYGASKHGVVGLLRGASPDLHDDLGISLNAVAPGPAVTGLGATWPMRGTVEGQVKKAAAPVSMADVMQTPDKPALAAAWLFSQGPEVYGRCVAAHAGRYREIEQYYDKNREEMMGGELGIPAPSDAGFREVFGNAF